MEDRIVRILPALLGQAAFGTARILDETVAIAVAEFVDPAQGITNIAPDRADEIQVAGALIIGACQTHEQRRGIHRAVIAANQYFAQLRQLSLARLMQNFSWLC